MNYQLTLVSSNTKTGPIPVSTSHRLTCPTSCGMRSVCYASFGPMSWNWERVTNGSRGSPWPTFLKQIEDLPLTQWAKGHRVPFLWRHNQAGDLPGDGDQLDIDMLQQLVEANDSRAGFTYTHKPLRSEAERAAVKAANDQGFTINLSADNLEEADRLYDLGIGPVATVLPVGATGVHYTPKGRKVVVCPAVTHKHVTCSSCRLCAIRERNVIPGFPLHGPARNKGPGTLQNLIVNPQPQEDKVT